jgi:hypothetical protein
VPSAKRRLAVRAFENSAQVKVTGSCSGERLHHFPPLPFAFFGSQPGQFPAIADQPDRFSQAQASICQRSGKRDTLLFNGVPAFAKHVLFIKVEQDPPVAFGGTFHQTHKDLAHARSGRPVDHAHAVAMCVFPHSGCMYGSFRRVSSRLAVSMRAGWRNLQFGQGRYLGQDQDRSPLGCVDGYFEYPKWIACQNLCAAKIKESALRAGGGKSPLVKITRVNAG